jgi:hypothetical protein
VHDFFARTDHRDNIAEVNAVAGVQIDYKFAVFLHDHISGQHTEITSDIIFHCRKDRQGRQDREDPYYCGPAQNRNYRPHKRPLFTGSLNTRADMNVGP